MNNKNNNIIDNLLKTMQAKAVIFDLDGTLIDNNAYHLQTWKIYLEIMKNYAIIGNIELNT